MPSYVGNGGTSVLNTMLSGGGGMAPKVAATSPHVVKSTTPVNKPTSWSHGLSTIENIPG